MSNVSEPFETDAGAKVFDSYESILKYTLENGTREAGTRSIKRASFGFYLGHINNQRRVLFPKTRPGKDFSISYALRELTWYVYGDRDPNPIGTRAPRWFDMADETGRVNSNYGFQLRHNVHVGQFIETTQFSRINDMADGDVFFIDLPIINTENMMSTYDLVCNLNVRAFVERRDTKYYLSLISFARSIDLVYGLPYDIFMLQVLGYALLDALKQNTRKNFRFEYAGLHIANAHIYDDQVFNTRMLLQDARKDYDKNMAVGYVNADSLLNHNLFRWYEGADEACARDSHAMLSLLKTASIDKNVMNRESGELSAHDKHEALTSIDARESRESFTKNAQEFNVIAESSRYEDLMSSISFSKTGFNEGQMLFIIPDDSDAYMKLSAYNVISMINAVNEKHELNEGLEYYVMSFAFDRKRAIITPSDIIVVVYFDIESMQWRAQSLRLTREWSPYI